MRNRRRTRKDFVLDCFENGGKPEGIWQEAERRFGHCGWGYVTKILREHRALQRQLADAMREHPPA